MDSNPESIDLLQQQAAQKKQQEYLNTNILQSTDPELVIAQDLIIGFAVSHASESITIDILKDSLVNAINSRVAIAVPVEGGGRKLILGKKALTKSIAAVEKQAVKLTQNSAKVINGTKTFRAMGQGFKAGLEAFKAGKSSAEAVKAGITVVQKAGVKKIATEIASEVAESVAESVAKKVGVKVATLMGQSAIKGTVQFATVCAVTGAETLGVGCLVGLAVMVLQLAFDAFNIAMDMIDPNGVSIVIYKPDIEMVSKTTGQWVNTEYSKDKPNYLDEEVFFDWESHLWKFDESDNLMANLEWTTTYEKYRDEYMTSIGITGDWRSRIPLLDLSKSTDPGVLSPLTVTFQEFKKEALTYQQTKNKTSNNSVLLFIVVFFVIIFLTFIIFFFII